MNFDISFLDQITPERIEQYLVSRGWKLHRLQPKGLRTRLSNHPTIKYAQVEVPVEKSIYYLQSVYHIIQHLAKLEKRDEKRVLDDLQIYDSEIVHALSPKGDDSAIPCAEKFIAVVDECRGDYNSEGLREGDVILKIFSLEGKTVKAKVSLPPELYRVAYENHGQKQGNFLEIVGKRIMKGRLDEIVDVEEVSLLKR